MSSVFESHMFTGLYHWHYCSCRSSSNGAEWELGVYHCDSLLFPNDDDDTAATDNDDDDELNLDAPWVKLVTVGGGGSGAVGDVSHVSFFLSLPRHLG